MNREEKDREIGRLASDLKKAKERVCCLDLKARRIMKSLSVFCQSLEADEPISTPVENGIQLRKHPGHQMTILEGYIEYPDRAEVLNLIRERDLALKELRELQAEWKKVEP